MESSTNAVIRDTVRQIESRARDKGFVTSDDVFEVLSPSQALDDDLVEELYARIAAAGIEVREVEVEAPLTIEALLGDRGRRPGAIDAALGDTDDTISLYLREIGSIPLLSGEDERTLAACYEQGRAADAVLHDPEARAHCDAGEIERLERSVREGEQARARLTHANTRLVVHIAKKYINNGVQLMDLIQEGNLGLIRAVEKFDFRRGFKFSTYATWWIRQAITRALADQARTIRLPVHMSEQIAKVNAVTRRLEQELGRPPSLDEIARVLDTTPRRVEQIIEVAQKPLSLEMKVGEDADSELGHFLADEDAPEPTEQASRELLRDEIVSVLDSLSRREREVLQLRYGLKDGTAHTLEEVGATFNVTRERIRQIETKAIRRLRHPTRSKKLRDYLR
jgi:RNA polymerase primary sigma factor